MKKAVAIIGAGPAGLSASIQLSRSGVSHYLFERSQPGGLLRNGNLIGNYTGVYPPLSGSSLIRKMMDHFHSFSQEITNSTVAAVRYITDPDGFELAAGGSVFRSDFIIAASGTKPVKSRTGSGVSHRLSEFILYDIAALSGLSGKQVLIVGGGDCAFDYSLTLAKSNHVEILNRTEKIKAIKVLREKVLGGKKIKYRPGTEILEITGGDQKPVKVKVTTGDAVSYQECDIIVFAIGRTPDDSYLSGIEPGVLQDLVKKGRIIYAGDIKNNGYRQAVIAAGNGIEAAMKITADIQGV